MSASFPGSKLVNVCSPCPTSLLPSHFHLAPTVPSVPSMECFMSGSFLSHGPHLCRFSNVLMFLYTTSRGALITIDLCIENLVGATMVRVPMITTIITMTIRSILRIFMRKIFGGKKGSKKFSGYIFLKTMCHGLEAWHNSSLQRPGYEFYIDSAITSCTSGTMRFSKPSIPAFSVIMEEGHPLQEPCNINSTFPSW